MIYQDITRKEYDALDGINHSKLKHFKNSIKHGAYKIGSPFNQTAAMRIGTATHTLILEPHKFDDEYVIGGPVNPKTGKTYGSDTNKFSDWLEQQKPGCKYLSDQEAGLVKRVAKNVKSDIEAMKWLDQCEYKETAIDWIDPKTGLKCKALLDAFSQNNLVFVDLKTIGQSISYDTLSKTVFNMEYFQQFAFYNDGLFHNNIKCNKVIAVFAQTADEQDVATAEIGIETLCLGTTYYQECLENYKAYLAGSRTGHYDGLFQLNVPPWSMPNFGDEDDEEYDSFVHGVQEDLCETL